MFFPLIVDTFGGWNGAALDVLSKLGRQVGKEEEEMVRHLRQRLSVILTRDNVAMLGSRAPTVCAASIDGDQDYDVLRLAPIILILSHIHL